MTSKLKELESKGLIRPPHGLADQVQYETVTGSISYGVSNDSSDYDMVGFAIPERKVLFPHEAGFIPGFIEKPQGFEVFTQHHILDESALGGKGRNYDISIYNIIKYVNLLVENNPNILETLFTANRLVLFMTPAAQIIRDNRREFLHKGSFHRLKGYAYQQLHKLNIKTPSKDSKRRELVDKFGYDTKFATHVVRLTLQADQILTEHDLDLEKNSEMLKSVRRGEWTLKEIEDYFKENELRLETVYTNSTLRHSPDIKKCKEILLSCLEQHFGNLSKAITLEEPAIRAIKEIEIVLEKYKQGKY